MAFDKWAQGIAETFLSVLRRPKYGFKVGELESVGGFSLSAIVEAHGDKFMFTISVNPKGVVVRLEENWTVHDPKKFRFVQKFDRVKTQKIRQKALICVKKLEAKGTYDVLNV